MGDFSAATRGLKISDAKASIVEEFRRMRKWQEDQRQEFQKKQLREHESILQLSEKNFEQFYEQQKAKQRTSRLSNNTTDQSLSGSEVSYPDQSSSINGHMLNCFSDSSHDGTNLYTSKDTFDSLAATVSNSYSSLSDIVPQKACFAGDYLNEEINSAPQNHSAPKRPRPYLKKGAGLERYKPKQKTNLKVAPKCTLVQKMDHVPHAKVALKLKPAIHSSTSPPRKVNRVKFCESVQTLNQQITDSKPLFFPSRDNPNTHSCQVEVEESNFEGSSITESQELEDKSSSCDLSLNAEKKELDEFEILENCAQNSSFNSDSSIVQRVLNGEPLQPLFENPRPNKSSGTTNCNYEITEDIPIKNADNFMNLEDFHSRKQRLDHLISSFEPAIPSLQRELVNSNRNSYEKYECEDVTRCSTPVDETAALSSSTSECDSSINSSSNTIKFDSKSTIENSQHDVILQDRDAAIIEDYIMNENNSYKKNDASDLIKDRSGSENNKVPSEKSKLREKMEELENEIKNYQAERAQLATSAKERDMLIKQLKKERDEFQKNKLEEMNKFHSEMESEKQQFKREKETFNRLKKATLDHRNRKEREDLSTLKKEVEKLQQDLKKEKIKFNNETRKLKNQLATAEKDRDNLKLQNITLEDQIEDLVAALKVRIALDGKSQAKGHSKTDKVNKVSNSRKESDNGEENAAPFVSQGGFKEVHINVENSNDGISQTRPKVHFNLAKQIQENIPSSFLSDSGLNENYSEIHPNNIIAETTVDSGNKKPPYEEKVYDDKIETVHTSGEVETLYLNGDRKKVSADGKTITFFFHNGDVKEILSDERTIYNFANGDIQRSFPSGLIVTELINSGQVQKKMPDGTQEVTFPDGTINYFYRDGSEKIITPEGTVAYLDADGTKTYEFKNCIKEIHKDGIVRREYPDGGLKIIYSCGRQETRYPNGRIRIKDKDGNVFLDTKHLQNLAGD